jgi:hypothetical protein
MLVPARASVGRFDKRGASLAGTDDTVSIGVSLGVCRVPGFDALDPGGCVLEAAFDVP